MRRPYQTRPARLTILVCAALTLATSVPFAYAAAEGAAIEEVVVTARKREESLQDVPIAGYWHPK